ncbi:hypothetical protein RRG08_025495 [Elysia crispata]|uniref:Uncharacterized protein n=1 Tax=Elysia crispata TaxID=231223 RepID=A0AAE1CR90_9GAST|nr:hypothetical protein RRG08_025495 [Elysia crispata]
MRHLVIVSWSMKVLSLSRCLELSSYHNHETPRDSVLVYEGVESLKIFWDSVLVYEGVVSLTVPRTILMSQLIRHLVIVSWSIKVLCITTWCLELSSYHNHETPRDSVLVYEGVVSLTVPRTILMSQLIRRLVIVSWSMRVLCLSRCLELSSCHN